MDSIVHFSGGITNTVFLGVMAASSVWFCYIHSSDLAIRRREVRMNVITTTLTLTAGVIGSYLAARTRRDSIAHAMVVHRTAAKRITRVPTNPARRKRTANA